MSNNTRELVQIEASEDVNAVRDRLSFIRGQRVLLVWPEEGTALTRRLDLVLIQREAMRRAIRLALVTHDPDVIRHAKELNISTFETIGASERGRWKRARAKVFTNRLQRPLSAPVPADLMSVASRVRMPRPSLSALQNGIVRLLIVAFLLGVVGAVAYLVVPSATVTLVPAQQIVETSIQIRVNTDPDSSDIDVENAILPATLLRVEIEEEAFLSTTGERNLGSSQALGTVVFINNTDEAISIPQGTTVGTSAGTPIMFRTLQTASLPAGDGQQVEVPIEAMPGSAGGVGNVPENLINTVTGPLAERVTVRNLAPTTGGQTRTVRVVSQSDRDRLLAAMRQQLQERAYTEMLSLPQITSGDIVIPETLRIIEERNDWTRFDNDINAIADTLSLTMRAIVEAVAVDLRLAQQIVFAQMAGQIPRGRSIDPDTISYTHGDVLRAGDTITFTMSGRGVVRGQVRADQIRDQIAGRTLEDALDYLTTRVDLAEGSQPQIELSPDWLRRLPVLPMRINVVVRENSP